MNEKCQKFVSSPFHGRRGLALRALGGGGLLGLLAAADQVCATVAAAAICREALHSARARKLCPADSSPPAAGLPARGVRPGEAADRREAVLRSESGGGDLGLGRAVVGVPGVPAPRASNSAAARAMDSDRATPRTASTLGA